MTRNSAAWATDREPLHRRLRRLRLLPGSAPELGKYGIEAQHPDEFITHFLDLAPHRVCSAAKQQRESLKKPPLTVDEYLASLERQGLAQTVAALREFAALI
ncbi:MAG: hypothetical protein K2V38_27430 [Gemmataceae bacterium]|nr:hypothetical protein [Gemmataceae bacterium]